MLRAIAIILLFLVPSLVFAQPANDNCSSARVLSNVSNYCSDSKEFNNQSATESNLSAPSNWPSQGRDVWFRFTAVAYDVNISVTGNSPGTAGGTLQSPLVALYATPDCANFQTIIGSSSFLNNVATYYKGGLTIGQIYYVRVSAANSNTGTFKLCVNNYNPILKSGQDYSTASILCGKDAFTQTDVTGAGLNNRESAGTCLGLESNTAWYKWTAATSGTLTFVITPTVTNNDVDWILYDLGTAANPSTPNASNAIRCAAGHGVDNSDCPSEPIYFKTGLNFTSTDFSEAAGCGLGQNGFVRYIDMVQGHVYALLVNNFTSAQNGFSVEFGGAGEFLGPQAAFRIQQNQPCSANENFVFTNQSTNYSNLKWTFGEGASTLSATTDGPFIIRYSTPGVKTVVLEAYSAQGCFIVASQTFSVGVTPSAPPISVNESQFCILDTIVLSTTLVANTTYLWAGPNNFTSDQPTVRIPVTSSSQAGLYSLMAIQGNCTSIATTITIPPILNNPIAAFRALPALPAKLALPVKVEFINESRNADTYLWDFGDGSTSSEENPKHEYTVVGQYEVTLIAFNRNVCSAIITKGTFIVTADNTVFIPNTFTPNGDTVNDEFVVTAANLKSYHIRIFSRWGEPLFEAVDIFENWTGLYNGEPLPVGTYYYVIDAIGLNEDTIKRSGSVTILR